MNKTKLAIIGSGGYIGAELNFFLKKKYKITPVSSKDKINKFCNKKNLERIILNNEIIIFLSNINSLSENEKYPFKNYKVSILPLKKICDVANKLKKKSKNNLFFIIKCLWVKKRNRFRKFKNFSNM